MHKLDREFISTALLEHDKAWKFGNQVLYDLCKSKPKHTDVDVIIAKCWLIGRTYAAALERRKNRDGFEGDAFYVRSLAPKIRDEKIDSWLPSLNGNCTPKQAIEVHGKAH
jgi:hypothetical protein